MFEPPDDSLNQTKLLAVDVTAQPHMVMPATPQPVVSSAPPVVESHDVPSVFRFNKAAFLITIAGLATVALIVSAGLLIANKDQKAAQSNLSNANSYGVESLQVNELHDEQQEGLKVKSLAVNGQLRANNTLVIAPSDAPADPTAGQIYFDKATNTPFYYNGTAFLSLAPTQPASYVGSLQGLNGDVTLTSGQGINVNNTTISNTGVLSLTGANGLIVSSSTGSVTVGLPTASSAGQCLLSAFGGAAFGACTAAGAIASGTSQTAGKFTIFDTTTDRITDSILTQSGTTSVTVAGTLNSTVGFQVGGLAASGTFLKGNGTNFVSGSLTASDLPSGSGSYIQNGTSVQSGANFNISGSGVVGTSLTVNGSALFQSSTNSITAFQIQNSTGTSNLLVADTTNSRIGINKNNPDYALDVTGEISATTGIRVNGIQRINSSGDVTARNLWGSSASLTVRGGSDNTASVEFTTQGGSRVLGLDTTNRRIMINSSSAPTYTLDVVGDINTTTVYRIGGIQICSSSGCAATAGSGSYIQNGISVQSSANFNISGSGTIGTNLVVSGIASGVNNTGTNVAGSALTLAGGQGTGTAAGGSIVFQYAPAGSTGSTANVLQTACTISGSNGSFSCPGSGTNSERFGANTTANSNGVALGANAQASTNAIAIGRSATTGGSGSAIGYQAYAGSSAVALGSSTYATGSNAVAIGAGAYTQGTNSTALGTSATTGASDTSSIALGYSAATTAANQLVIGSSADAIQNVFIGKGVTNTTPTGFTLQATGGSGTNIAGASTTIAGGKGTGTGNGGNVNVQVAKPGATGATANTLATVASFSGVNGAALFQNSADSATAFQVQSAGGTTIMGIDTASGKIFSGIPDSASAIGFTLNTPAYTTAGAKLLSVQNNGVEKFSIDKDGNTIVGGSLTINGTANNMFKVSGTGWSGGRQAQVHAVDPAVGTTTYDFFQDGLWLVEVNYGGMGIGSAIVMMSTNTGDGLTHYGDIMSSVSRWSYTTITYSVVSDATSAAKFRITLGAGNPGSLYIRYVRMTVP